MTHAVRLIAVLLLLVLQACGSAPSSRDAVPPVQTAVGEEVTSEGGGGSTPAAATTSSHPPAWQSLVIRARDEAADGEYQQAIALLSRAQRIDGDAPEIYLELARVYGAMGDAGMSAASAERGLLYCSQASLCKELRRYLP